MNLANFKNIDEMVEFVKWLDNDKNAYMAMLNEPLITEKNHQAIFDKRLKDFLDNIFSLPLENAYERGFGQWRMNIENRYKKYQKTRRIANIPQKYIKSCISNIKRIFKSYKYKTE